MCQMWLVTSAGRGLGEATAQAVLEAGHQVVATARDTRTLDVAFRHVPAERNAVRRAERTVARQMIVAWHRYFLGARPSQIR
jgi:NAD(P)-dependent dehydrogenase (short-subunit alcohol dehydrogenase family)